MLKTLLTPKYSDKINPYGLLKNSYLFAETFKNKNLSTASH